MSNAKSVKDSMRRKQAMLREFKAARGCNRCGESDPACLDFHHRPGEEKAWELTRRYKHGGTRRGGNNWGAMSYDGILAEVAKCEIVCANCHRKENALAFGWRNETEPAVNNSKRRDDFLKQLWDIPQGDNFA